MIYIHYTTIREILRDYNHDIEGECAAIEQNNGRYSKEMITALEGISDVHVSKWFKVSPYPTATLFDKRTWAKERRAGLEIVE